MTEMYVKNQGNAKTIIYNNKKKDVQQVNWNAEYDGNVANLAVNLLDNNKFKHYEATLDNKDLEEILGFPSINVPLDKRLMQDFKGKQSNPYILEIPNPSHGNPEEITVPLTINNNSKFVFKQKIKSKKHRSKKHKSKKHRSKKHRKIIS
jgi:hypothetical protein